MKILFKMILISVIAIPLSAQDANTWYVSTTGSDNNEGNAEHPFLNIQFALENAEPYDTVLVYPGIYYEAVDVWYGKVLKSIDGSESTIIDGSNIIDESYVVWLSGVIDGFTIRNSPNKGITNDGTDNAIYKNLIIEDNQGRGIYAYWANALIMENVIIRNNGGGMQIDGDVNINAENLIIYNNTANNGGGIYVGQGRFYLDHALIYNNHANVSGGGMYICCAEGNFPHLTITDNTSSGVDGVHVDTASYGYGIHFYNTIIWDNDLYAIGEDYIYAYYSIIEGWDWDHCSSECIGNYNVDPFFCDATNGDYSISESSDAATQGALCNYDDWYFYNDSNYYNTCEGWWYGENTGGYIGAFGVGCDDGLSTPHGVEIPEGYAMDQNYPNPFNPATTILYEVVEAGNVQLSVYNMNGQLIETLVNKITAPGYYSATWNGNKVSSGLYLYRLTSGGKTFTRKMLLMK